MPVTTTDKRVEEKKRIFVTRYGGIDRKELRAELAERAKKGQITARDEQLLEWLRELRVMSLDQISRLLWRGATTRTARNRLTMLRNYHLLSYARIPAKEMRGWGLDAGQVYALGLGGWMWLREDVDSKIIARTLKRENVLHDLLTSEICVRLTEAAWLRGEAWQITWAGEEAAGYYERNNKEVPLVAADGLVMIRQQVGRESAVLPMFFEMDRGREAHGRPSSDWGRKVKRYDRFISDEWRMHPQLADLPDFPIVAVVTHGAQRLLNLVESIKNHRSEGVVYYLALWKDLMARDDILSAPGWLMLPPDGEAIGYERNERQGILPPVGG